MQSPVTPQHIILANQTLNQESHTQMSFAGVKSLELVAINKIKAKALVFTISFPT